MNVGFGRVSLLNSEPPISILFLNSGPVHFRRAVIWSLYALELEHEVNTPARRVGPCTLWTIDCVGLLDPDLREM